MAQVVATSLEVHAPLAGILTMRVDLSMQARTWVVAAWASAPVSPASKATQTPPTTTPRTKLRRAARRGAPVDVALIGEM